MKMNLLSVVRWATAVAPQTVACGALLGLVLSATSVRAADELDVLKQDLGTWNAEITMWIPGEDEPAKATGTETNELLGRFVVSKFKGNFFGQEFEGRGQFGYDAQKKEYIGTWIDSMEPNMSFMHGTWDADKKTMTLYTKGYNSTYGREVEGKNVVVYKDDSRVMTMYMKNDEGEWDKSMEIKYTKKD